MMRDLRVENDRIFLTYNTMVLEHAVLFIKSGIYIQNYDKI